MKKSYSLAQLKGKIKVGMKVSADPDKENPCAKLKKDGSNKAVITAVEESYFCINGCYHPFSPYYYLMVDLDEPKTLDNLQKGDYVLNEYGNKRKVLARLEDLVFLSYSEDINNWETSGSSVCHIEELKRNGYKIANQEEPKEITKQEIADKFGIDVKDLKIKDE